MSAPQPHDLRAVTAAFQIDGQYQEAIPYGTGHINDTYCVTFTQAGQPVHYLIQRINHLVFKNPVALMDNVRRVTTHLHQKLDHSLDDKRRVLTLLPTRDGGVCHRDGQGNYWRGYIFIEGAHSHDVIKSPQQAYEAARAFGQFQKLLADLPAPRLHDTIPDFHHTPKRFAALQRAITADSAGRGKLARPEIEFALRQEPLSRALLGADVPERVTHNDTKINNVLLDDKTMQGICVIDLDTVMPGLAAYDFGDMVRTATSPAAEDELDLSKVYAQPAMFEALARGYLSTAAEFLTPTERATLIDAGKVITFEIGIRFLTDFLQGDVYFKVHRENHNLHRCRTQFKLVESLAAQEKELAKFLRP